MYFFKKEMYWQTALYFALVDHLVQERSDRLLLQENRFLEQYLVPAKLNASNSGVHDTTTTTTTTTNNNNTNTSTRSLKSNRC